ncbi:unnamed protein product [Closterium sp. NIES-54]
MDVWGPPRVRGQGHERYFLLVVDDYSRYTTVFPLRRKGDITEVLIDWICNACHHLSELFDSDLPVLRLHSDRGGEFSSDLLRAFCRAEGIRQTFTLPASPQQNGIAEHRIGMVMDVACTSMIHAAALQFLWPFVVQYAAHQINLQPHVSLPETTPTLRWTGKVGDASAFRDVTFDESVSYYHLFPYCAASLPPSPLFLAPGTPPVDPLPPQGPAPSGVTQIDLAEPVEVVVDSGAARGSDPAGAGTGGAEPGGAEPERVESGGAEPAGAEPGGAEPERVEPRGAEHGGTASGDGEPTRVESGGSPGVPLRREPLSPQRLPAGGAAGAGSTRGAAGAGAAGGAAGAGATGGAAGAGAAGGAAGHSRRYSRPLHYLGLLLTLDRLEVLRSDVSLSTHSMTLHPSTAPQPVPLPSPPASSLPDGPDPESDYLRAASPIVTHFLATALTDPLFESTTASALVDFAAACRLDYATSLVAESASASVYPPSVGGECALGTDVLEDRQEEFECFAAAVPHLVSMLLAPEGDPDAPDIPTPRSDAEAVEGPYSSQWQAAMDAEMASWKSTGTYVEEVPPPGANIISGMWIFRVKRPPGSPPIFKARYVARGFSQRQGVDFFQTFSPTPKMTTLWVLLHVAAQRDYELHSLDFSTAFLQGSLHEEIWLRRPPGFTGSFPAGTHFAPSTADPSLFLRTDTTLPPFYVLVYVDDLVFATADSEALAHVKSELQKRHTCIDLAPPSDESVEPSGPYTELVGCLMYLMTCTRPDLAYPLSLLARYVAPGRHRKVHWDAAKRVLRYLCSTSGMGLVLGGRARVVLTGHADASWVDDLATERTLRGDFVIHPELALPFLTGLVTSCSPPLCLWGFPTCTHLLSSLFHSFVHILTSPRLSPQQLHEWFVRRTCLRSGGSGAGGADAAEAGGTGVADGVGFTGGTATTSPGGACTRGTGVAGIGGVEGAGAGYLTESGTTGAGGAGAGGAGVSGPGAGVAGVGGLGVAGAGDGGAGAVHPGSTSQPSLQPASPLPTPSPYTEKSGGLTERREHASHPILPVRTSRRVPRSRPPPVPGTHAMAPRPSSVPLRLPLPAHPESSLPEVPKPEFDHARAVSPTVSCILATAVTDPSFESAAASALVAELLDFAAACRLDYASALVAEFAQEDFECLAAAVPCFSSMHLAPEGDADAPDIPTPRSYAEAITGPYSSQWKAAMDAEMASWKSTVTYVDTSLPPFYILVYVDDLVFATADTEALTLVKSELQKRHTCTDLGPSALRLPVLLATAHSSVYNHSLSAPPSDESVEPSGPYPELVGCLMYLMTYTQPDLAYPLSLLACYVAPGRHRKVHWDDAKRVLRYLCSTSGMGLVLGGRGPVVLTAHADTYWVDDSATQRSSQGYTFSLEIYAGAMAAQELRWLTYLLTDLGEQPRSPSVLYVDNKAMIALCQEHRLEHRTKHIALRYFLARELQ